MTMSRLTKADLEKEVAALRRKLARQAAPKEKAPAKSGDADKRFKATFQKAAVGIAHLGLDGHYLAVNPAFCALLDCDEKTVLKKSYLDITHPEDVARDLAGAQNLIEGRIDAYSVEKRYLRGDGSPAWVHLVTTLAKDKSGKPEYFISLATDIGERKRLEAELRTLKDDLESQVARRTAALTAENAARRAAEAALASSENRFRGIFDSSADGLAVIDAKGAIIAFNPAAEKLFGCKAREVAGRPLLVFLGDAAAKALDALLAGASPAIPLGTPGEAVGQRLDGTRFPLEITLSEMIGGESRQFVANLRDIALRKEYDRRLKESEERFRAITEASPLPILVLRRKDGGILFANPAAGRVFALPAPELIKRRIVDFYVNPSDRIRVLEAYARTGRLDGHEIFFKRANGQTFWVVASGRPAIYDGQEVFVASFSDVNDMKRVQIELRQARRDADLANRAKSEFLSRMTHELRTPMNAILGFGRLLQSQKLPETEAGYVTRIMRAGEHLLGLVGEVLDLARIESGRDMLKPEAVAPLKVIGECRELIEPLAEARKVEVKGPSDGAESPDVWIDPKALRQILLNLMSNAVKYNRPGGKVTVEMGRMRQMIRLSVTDTGPGIPAAKSAEVFTPFARLGAETSPVEGTGIGLAITKRLVERSKGRIGYVSAEGRGTTFWVDLPAAPAPGKQRDAIDGGSARELVGSHGGRNA